MQSGHIETQKTETSFIEAVIVSGLACGYRKLARVWNGQGERKECS